MLTAVSPIVTELSMTKSRKAVTRIKPTASAKRGQECRYIDRCFATRMDEIDVHALNLLDLSLRVLPLVLSVFLQAFPHLLD